MWSWSSCERKTHRTSSGSTTENVLSQPLLADERAAGVDDDRLRAADHERVGTEERSRRLGGERRDEPGVVGDAVGVGVECDRDHVIIPFDW